ncbi:helix-turn-helix domain-containing protein [Methylorubrum extorquens]|uniref:Transcriptional regulator, XRE family n=1 Tax=Methylorubrum extorquens (strain ATCC 14718 / DSM 1338 / JCM 2805 / NCIMB 9133 / AM1) TaxID=272630 RepID=C5APF2_METEA|nr:helix-turn-helix transcriptional regulator [Methylorubrum extorquens]ACS38037.1 Transcriptional regulator, XRE family [Methylorubrum extorquens AM1]MCP1543920.1 transcriptional regulator with XRE-family HTH domain [Methylorubrum extorquens]MCP1588734.1 transcriptional regulator with XRE-family HTH domain [Methylorubrum extorquens]
MSGRGRLAWNLRLLRGARGLSQETLAVDAGVAAPYLSGIERGVRNPTVDVLDRLAGALGVEIDALLRAPDADDTPPMPLRAGRKPGRPRTPKAGYTG